MVTPISTGTRVSAAWCPQSSAVDAASLPRCRRNERRSSPPPVIAVMIALQVLGHPNLHGSHRLLQLDGQPGQVVGPVTRVDGTGGQRVRGTQDARVEPACVG